MEKECTLKVMSDAHDGVYVSATRSGCDSNGQDEITEVDFRFTPADALRIGTALIQYAMHGRISEDDQGPDQ